MLKHTHIHHSLHTYCPLRFITEISINNFIRSYNTTQHNTFSVSTRNSPQLQVHQVGQWWIWIIMFSLYYNLLKACRRFVTPSAQHECHKVSINVIHGRRYHRHAVLTCARWRVHAPTPSILYCRQLLWARSIAVMTNEIESEIVKQHSLVIWYRVQNGYR